MNESYIFNLKQSCKNRGVTLVNNGDGTITLNGRKFETMRDCEDYLIQIPRTDFNAGEN